MCGIAGFIERRRDAAEVMKNMTDCMIHRGPDAEGFWCDEKTGVTLGHRRLAIVDLSANGAQPMISASGRYVIVFNGEIYNAPAVREKLKEKRPDLKLRGTSDTEILLEAFECFGIECTVSLIKGMFAIGLYDRVEECLYLFRDRAGEKPLYYGYANGHFLFASDPAALRKYPPFDGTKEVSRNALAAYMRYGFIPAPLSVYEGIRKLLPGTYLKLPAPFTQYEICVYWSMREAALRGEKEPYEGTFLQAADELERLLLNAIQGQMISDVPIGAFLSGGIDSPLIVSLMQEISTSPVKTFTIGFEDKKYDEAEYAKEIAAHLGTEHTQLYVTQQDLLDGIPKLSGIFTEPFADSSQIPTVLVSKLARSKVTVSLSGDAGDELFGGYNTYTKIAALYQKSLRIPKWCRRMAGSVIADLPFGRTPRGFRTSRILRASDIMQMHEAVCYHTDYYGEHCVLGADPHSRRGGNEEPQISSGESELSEIASCMMLKDMQTYHPDDILVKVDRAGMAVSLENRVPLLDKDVMEFAWRLPIGYKIGKESSGIVSKRILREILYRRVPREMLDRPKKGFSVPIGRWLCEGKTKEWADELIEDSHLIRDGYFDGKAVGKMRREFQKGKADAQMIWQILMAEAWYRNE